MSDFVRDPQNVSILVLPLPNNRGFRPQKNNHFNEGSNKFDRFVTILARDPEILRKIILVVVLVRRPQNITVLVRCPQNIFKILYVLVLQKNFQVIMVLVRARHNLRALLAKDPQNIMV